ncbi:MULTISPECIES: response regulator transcription factor [Marinobacter]|jgi:two-component system OmpR family response regulator/two-component system response regulator QseB|uniref:DNA-binding response regulator n=3 Tax=Marinobacter TaxID=2742 RepID=A0A259W2V5_9GAMM|nr:MULTISPECIES: response regulator transcription factor [Marinobacter]MCG8523180.1 response regulator transcription factor [Pseudomonadales bacterium]MEC9083479.1 response regulator transcription factor [Pseudomonadota bacterium]ABM17392.1 two component transcriptional regulator, winged helix family [Marinobacter nauticus VT8]KAE8547486.1 Two-component system response regulator QseB [Marinobacter nauticus]MAC22158.1 DNA-binding response regulator [Marinobacter sp.]|tara:strand:+ start:2394 stop:3077 length:684 start_codon:yes stop_codon:yes gene_type:complete
MRILLTEDDHPLANTMLSMLRDDQNTVDWVDDGQQALNALLNESFDLAILDLTLPRVDGLDIVRQVREQGVELPIIILTARSELTEKLQGLDAGADDYLTKPFAMSELKARIRAVTRRRSGTRVSGLKVGRLVLDPDSAQLQVGTETFVLPRSELQILHYLMRHPDQVATRRRLEEQLYGWDQGAESNALEVHVHHLRRRLGKQAIRTVRGVGYMLDSKAASEGQEI